MAHYPKVSVIIPVYNVEKYLARCLDSVLGQSFHDIEVLCIDDGSTDSSPEILRRYADRDARIRIITQENQGVSAARNAGLDAAKGEWIAFVDSDDEVMPDIWETLLTEVRDEDAVCFSAEEIQIKDGKQTTIHSGYFDVKYAGPQKLADNDLFDISMTVWDKLYRRCKVEEIVLRFPEGMRFEDNVFVLNFFALYRNVRFYKKKLYKYFRHESSFTIHISHKKENISFDYIRILDHIHVFWKKNGLLSEKQTVFERICFDRLRFAVENCLEWERCGIVHALASRLNHWGLIPSNSHLKAVKEGKISIRLGAFPGKDITMLKPLNGLKKILYIGNCQNHKVICLFTIVIARVSVKRQRC